MLKNLKYSVTFADTGRTLSADITFQQGFTAITGPNECGKTMVFEMARYLLFGVDALRGPASDYKTLKASGEFIIRDNVIELERTTKTSTMKRNGVVIATGTSPVNAKVIEELGFALPVFDVACAINQGEVERLGSMLPAQRKALIDGVLGLAVLDNISKWTMEEARTLDKQAESINGRVVPAGVAPAQPEGFVASDTLVEPIRVLRAEAEELAGINGFLSVPVREPVLPVCEIDKSVADLQIMADMTAANRRAAEMLRAQIGALPSEAPYSLIQLDEAEWDWSRYDRYDAALNWLTANPRPPWVSDMQLQVFADDWLSLGNIERRSLLMEKIWALQAKGSKPCPHCNEDIPLEADAIERLQAEHDAFSVPDNGKVPPTPPIASNDIASARQQLRNFDEAKHREMSAVEALNQPLIPRVQIPTLRLAIDQVKHRAVLALELLIAEEALQGAPDWERQLLTRKSFEAASEAHASAVVAFEANQTERVVKTARAAELAGVTERRNSTETLHMICRDYEMALAAHTRVLDEYNRAMVVIKDFQDQAEEHRKIRNAMTILRGLIKQHVLPSLNKVSSHLLRQMTGGQRNLIVVDEDFNVRVDQQNLETLSGSGKAVANLAIRIALGQVLTNKVLSILLADEIDASMDAFRAEKTSNVLRILEDSVSQVLLVSHKSVEAPNNIRLGDDFEHDDTREAA